MAAEDVLAEALARVEFKMDILLKAIAGFTGDIIPMSLGHECAVCKQRVNYQVNLMKGVVERRCGCSTGKFVSTFIFSPTEPGKTDDRNNQSITSDPRTEGTVDPNRAKRG